MLSTAATKYSAQCLGVGFWTHLRYDMPALHVALLFVCVCVCVCLSLSLSLSLCHLPGVGSPWACSSTTAMRAKPLSSGRPSDMLRVSVFLLRQAPLQHHALSYKDAGVCLVDLLPVSAQSSRRIDFCIRSFHLDKRVTREQTVSVSYLHVMYYVVRGCPCAPNAMHISDATLRPVG